jgi:hypothetical protein
VSRLSGAHGDDDSVILRRVLVDIDVVEAVCAWCGNVVAAVGADVIVFEARKCGIEALCCFQRRAIRLEYF